ACKNAQVLKYGLQALKIAADNDVTICYGSDLLGPLGQAQAGEFGLRAQVLTPLQIMQSATINPARMAGCETSLGQIKAGFEADILVTTANPLDDVTVFDDADKNIMIVMKEGRLTKSRLEGVQEDIVPVRVKSFL
ncbi:unnamed protein product, partial [Fusarium langsethiae]